MPGGDRGGGRHRAGAHPVHGEAGDALGQPRQQRGGAAQGQALVAGLGGRGDRDLVDPVGGQVRVAAHEVADDLDDQVVGAGLGVDALGAGLAERGADTVDEDDVARGARAGVLRGGRERARGCSSALGECGPRQRIACYPRVTRRPGATHVTPAGPGPGGGDGTAARAQETVKTTLAPLVPASSSTGTAEYTPATASSTTTSPSAPGAVGGTSPSRVPEGSRNFTS